jgi:hypothetical protein
MTDNEIDISNNIIGFKDEISTIQSAITNFEKMAQKSDIAIISEPFAGKTTLVKAIEKMIPEKVTMLSLLNLDNKKEILIMLEQIKGIVIIDDCHLLYMRKIGGFDLLESFLRLIASSDNLFLTTWNVYSWRYLVEVLNISQFFPIQINLPQFTTPEIKELLLTMYDMNQIQFVEDVDKKKIRSTPFSLFRKRQKAMTAENVVFEKIKQVSNGNPGVARVIWDKSLESQTIKPSQINAFSLRTKPDYNEAFILSIILSMQSIKKEELMEIVEPEIPIDMVLYKFLKEGILAFDEGYYHITPEALYNIMDFLKKTKLVW